MDYVVYEISFLVYKGGILSYSRHGTRIYNTMM